MCSTHHPAQITISWQVVHADTFRRLNKNKTEDDGREIEVPAGFTWMTRTLLLRCPNWMPWHFHVARPKQFLLHSWLSGLIRDIPIISLVSEVKLKGHLERGKRKRTTAGSNYRHLQIFSSGVYNLRIVSICGSWRNSLRRSRSSPTRNQQKYQQQENF